LSRDAIVRRAVSGVPYRRLRVRGDRGRTASRVRLLA